GQRFALGGQPALAAAQARGDLVALLARQGQLAREGLRALLCARAAPLRRSLRVLDPALLRLELRQVSLPLIEELADAPLTRLGVPTGLARAGQLLARGGQVLAQLGQRGSPL
ncbi:MAG TPA: hypothetical protein DEA08_16590, partial [Planctomycetes bacterium]|nr:hypothetical protein [Planctomycetota bacterium]